MAIPLYCIHHIIVVHLILPVLTIAQSEQQFIYNGFHGAINLHLDGTANIHHGLLQMTNASKHQTGHAFFPDPMTFKPNSSFSTSFVFAIHPEIANHSSWGMVFVISPSMNFQRALSAEYLGLFNDSTNGLSSNHLFAVELDSIRNHVIGGNHVGIDVNGLDSVDAAFASYYSDKEGVNRNLSLLSGDPMQVWIDYDGAEKLVDVTLAPLRHPKPSRSLLSTHIDLSSILLESMYIGFSASTGGILASNHYLLGWSWNQSGKAQDLDPSKLPSLPSFRNHRLNLTFLLLLIFLILLLAVVVGVAWYMRRKKYGESYEAWEREYAPHRFSYKDLYAATKGFRNSGLLGVGGFGKVYKGVFPSTHAQIAVKRISHDSKQGMKEFMSEIASMRRLRHKNLVQLLGYCRRKGELLLVYDYMPNGSLDKFLFSNNMNSKLHWCQRFKIIKGVAAALLYLHEGWEQVVLHRDVKASNVLLDAEMNARLGDFGLSRLYDHDTNAQTTHVVGTMGYLAPEACRTRKPTTFTDIYAFGMFLLEVCCGRRPIDERAVSGNVFLVDWVYGCWKRGAIFEASDPKLEGSYEIEELQMVLKLGLLCVHPKAEERPAMRQIVRFLEGDAAIPDVPCDFDPESIDFLKGGWGSSSSVPPLSFETNSGGSLSMVNSVVHCGR